jgi:hypothetical protein
MYPPLLNVQLFVRHYTSVWLRAVAPPITLPARLSLPTAALFVAVGVFLGRVHFLGAAIALAAQSCSNTRHDRPR